MKLYAFDTETFPIRPGMVAPTLVCGSFADKEGEVLRDHKETILTAGAMLKQGATLVLHNAPYDFGVLAAEEPALLPLIFDSFEKGLIRDTQVRAQLRDIAAGDFSLESTPSFYTDNLGNKVKIRYNLDALAQRYLNRKLNKDEEIRLRFGTLYGKPLHEWPERFVNYAKQDARATYDVFDDQRLTYTLEEGEEEPGQMPTEIEQNCANWALHLLSLWGLRTDKGRVFALRDRLVAQLDKIRKRLKKAGVMRENGTKDMKFIKELVFKAYNGKPPLTDGGSPSTEKDVLADSGRPILQLLSKVSSIDKVLTTYVPALLTGISVPINSRFSVLVSSNRTSSSNPNVQNPNREGDVRGCFEPRPGCVFFSCDFDTQELRSLAQVCLVLVGWSEMAEALKNDEDIHLSFAAQLLGISYEEALARYKAGDKEVASKRQFAKICNFGFPGGLGAEAFVAYAKGYGIKITEEFATELRNAWFKRWPEMKEYFKIIASITRMGDGQITLPFSGFVRGGLTFTQAANGYFQGHTAWAAKRALWRVSKESYLDRSSPLYGARLNNFIHDELFGEVYEERAAGAVGRVQKIMQDTMQECIPDIPAKAGAVLMRRWYKGAKPVYVNGLLVPSKPTDVDGKTVWVHDEASRHD